MRSRRHTLAHLLALLAGPPFVLAGCFGSHGLEGAGPPREAPPEMTEVDSCDDCTLDEVCVQPCGGAPVVCVPRPEKICDAPECGCYASDPCQDVHTTEAACAAVDPAPATLERPATLRCACAGPAPTCDDHLRSRVAGGCGFSGTCETEIEGIPCCTRFGRCEDGAFVEETWCEDDCAQSCELIGNQRDCEGFGCAWDGAACS